VIIIERSHTTRIHRSHESADVACAF